MAYQVNNREYEFGDLQLLLNGNDITGIRGIKYDETADRKVLFAKGRYGHSVQTGNITCGGEITCTQTELEALINAGGGSILNLKGLTAIVSYGDGTAISQINDRIEGIAFGKSEKELKQGDPNMEVKIPFVALRIYHQQ